MGRGLLFGMKKRMQNNHACMLFFRGKNAFVLVQRQTFSHSGDVL